MSLSTRVATAEAALVALLRTITLPDGHAPAVYPESPGPAGVESPALIVNPPDLERRQPEAGETILGRTDWTVEWLVEAAVVFDADPEPAQTTAKALAATVIETVDAAPTIGGVFEDAVVYRATYDVRANQAGREFAVYSLRLRATVYA